MEKKKNITKIIFIILAVILIVVGAVFAIKHFSSKGNDNGELITVTTAETNETSTSSTSATTADTSTETSTDISAAAPVEASTSEGTTAETEPTTLTSSVSVETTVETSTSIETLPETSTAFVAVEVQSFAAKGKNETFSLKKSNEEIAKEVWQGRWGCGAERKRRLIEAGYNYSEIQKLVNEMAKGKTSPKETTPAPSKGKLTFVKTFTRGTYYCYGCAKKGGSGRQLISCSSGGQGVKGSIASWYLYKNYGYKRNGRTKVYLEVSGYSSMTGWYYLDDSCAPGYNNVIDFFYINGRSCPFSKQGVVSVKCYI